MPDEKIDHSISIRTERFPAPAQLGVDVSDNRSARNDRAALLSQRAAVILLLGVLTALGAGALTCFNGGTLASAALVGGAAFGAGVTFFHTVID
ncbi:hypothetical protein AB0C96_29695 [Streptomyces sp. NPDC048506]|uniref:hypothetical protein n=1 Tax=Streptomyces sp. NPDC048506 TaxID=3155028 RepID=UPI003440221E